MAREISQPRMSSGSNVTSTMSQPTDTNSTTADATSGTMYGRHFMSQVYHCPQRLLAAFRAVLCGLCFLCAFALETSDLNSTERPNILLLVADDQRPDTIAALG